MRKIRKFKVAVHLKEIYRRIKSAQVDRNAAGLALESDLAVFITALHSDIEPGLVYELIDGNALELSTAGIERGGKFVLCALTLGSKIEEHLKTISNIQALTIANIIVSEFLRTAVIFTSDLIKEEALKEDLAPLDYEILYSPLFSYGGEPKFLREAKHIDRDFAGRALKAVLERLNAQKINVSYSGKQMQPAPTLVFILPFEKKKGKK